MTIFEDFDQSYAEMLGAAPIGTEEVDIERVVDPIMGAAYAVCSLALEQLCVSYMISAEDFLRACMPNWSWPALQVLSLTSPTLKETAKCREIYALLCDAGAVALQMPRLHIMQIWNGGRRNACAFIYRMHRRDASITWRSTWGLTMPKGLVEIWARVAASGGAQGFRVYEQKITEKVASHGDAIQYLYLPRRVVTEMSAWQIRMEAPPLPALPPSLLEEEE